MRQRSSHNWNFKAGTWDALKTEYIDFSEDYPLIGSAEKVEFIGTCSANEYKMYSPESLVSMFVDDYILERFWNRPTNYIGRMSGAKCVMSPDFSLLIGMPKPMLQWNVYRNRLVGYVWEAAGVRVIPTVSWSDESSFEYCFQGVRSGSVVAVSNTGCRTAEQKRFFDNGYNEMLKQINPAQIVFQCTKALRGEYMANNIVFIDSFFAKRIKTWEEEAGKG